MFALSSPLCMFCYIILVWECIKNIKNSNIQRNRSILVSESNSSFYVTHITFSSPLCQICSDFSGVKWFLKSSTLPQFPHKLI